MSSIVVLLCACVVLCVVCVVCCVLCVVCVCVVCVFVPSLSFLGQICLKPKQPNKRKAMMKVALVLVLVLVGVLCGAGNATEGPSPLEVIQVESVKVLLSAAENIAVKASPSTFKYACSVVVADAIAFVLCLYQQHMLHFCVIRIYLFALWWMGVTLQAWRQHHCVLEWRERSTQGRLDRGLLAIG